tara:strand:+ start:642 stop:1091 length:450 start_codon:yes stop_codon:yes gene_type:complete
MKKDEFDKLFISIIDQVKSTRDQGQKEYAHTESNVFANFERTANQLNTTKDKVLMTFLLKHIDGITAHINGHESQREDIRGRIKDAIVYLTLYWGMVEDEMWGDKWEQMGGVKEFIESHKIKTPKKPNGSIFNPETGEVNYQNTGDECI